MSEFLTVEDLMRRYGVAKADTIYAWAKKGTLPAPIKMGQRLLWREDEVLHAEESKRNGEKN